MVAAANAKVAANVASSVVRKQERAMIRHNSVPKAHTQSGSPAPNVRSSVSKQPQRRAPAPVVGNLKQGGRGAGAQSHA